MPTLSKLFILASLFGATWILATHTIGKAVNEHDPVVIGFAVALLVGAGLVALLSVRMEPLPGSRLGLVLLICGGVCLALALIVQMVVVRSVAESVQAAVVHHGQVNLNVNFASGVSWFVCLASVFMVAVGIRFSVTTSRSVSQLPATDQLYPHVLPAPEAPAPLPHLEQGIRPG
jgi:hypothetical protein